MTSPLLPLLLSLCFAQAEEEEPPPQPPEPVWTWTRKEERELRKLEREVTGGASRCALEQTQWKVNTFGSARFAAEVGLYLDLFEATVLEQLDTKRQFSEAPTVVIYKTRTEFQEKAPMKSGAGLIYHAITEPPGKGKHRIKILDNHLYAYIENVEDPGLNDLDLRALRAEAAQAILIGVLGRPEVAIWFEKGVAEYFASWDLHEPPGQAPELRRARSPGLAALREHLRGNTIWLPPLDRLTNLRPTAWDARQMSEEVSNDAFAESIIDLLVTEKKARSLREKIVREYIKVGLSGTRIASLPKKELEPLEKLWAKHVDQLVK